MEGPGKTGNVVPPAQRCDGIAKAPQFLHLQVKAESGLALPSALFTKDVIVGMLKTQGMAMAKPELPLEVLVLSDTEVLLKVREETSREKIQVGLVALEYWLGEKVQVSCREASSDEVEQARVEERRRGQFQPRNLGIGSVEEMEATFPQWVHDVREAQRRFPEYMVERWILESLKGLPASAVRNLGPETSVQTILTKLKALLGAVQPFDVMRKGTANTTRGTPRNVRSTREGATKPVTNAKKKGKGGACHGCGGTGHLVRECPNPHLKSLNSKGGGQKKGTSPSQKKKAST